MHVRCRVVYITLLDKLRPVLSDLLCPPRFLSFLFFLFFSFFFWAGGLGVGLPRRPDANHPVWQPPNKNHDDTSLRHIIRGIFSSRLASRMSPLRLFHPTPMHACYPAHAVGTCSTCCPCVWDARACEDADWCNACCPTVCPIQTCREKRDREKIK